MDAMTTVDQIIQEMRRTAYQIDLCEGFVSGAQINAWADALEAAIPPNAAAEIERLDGLCVQAIDLMKKKDAEIERLKALLSHWRECWSDGCNPDGDVVDDTDAALDKESTP
jgi:hypothetical protein